VSASGTLSYAELAARAGGVAALLRERGAGPESVVAICLDRSPEMVAAILGVLAAGAAYLPLDPHDPPRRLEALLEDAGARTCLAGPEAAHRISTGGRTALLAPDPPPGEPAPAGAARPEGLAYVMYTSGSTGRPKGVMVEHRSILNRLRWFCREHRIGPDDVFVQKTPYTFDVSVPEFFCPLMTGARLVLARPGGHRDPAYVCRLIQETAATTVHFVPSMLGAVLEEPELGRCRSLRRVLSSGEALSPALRDRFLAAMAGTGCELVNLYGPTETAVEVTAAVCRPEPGERVVPIGTALPGVRLHVLDRELRPVVRGEPGELCVGGVQVARGYLGRPDVTAAAFVPDPDGAGGRLYRTGDLVRERTDGALEFHGRLDDQVKVRGFRVEPGEIEAALAAHPGVGAAAVAAIPGPDGDARLVAWVVPRAGAEAPAGLAAFLGERLPAHMVPSRFLPLAEVPLTASGKLDRRALAEPESGTQGEAPRTPAERAVAAIWEEVLGRGPVGREQDFFELGGHSLAAARVVSRMALRLGIRLDVRDLLEARTVAALAGRHPTGPAGDGPVPDPGPPRPSASQRRLWFVEQVAPGTVAANVAIGVRLRGRLAAGSLERALTEVVRRHDVLRSRFPTADGEPGLELLDPWTVELPPVPVPAGEAAAALERFAAEPFDLDRGPLFRARLLRLGEDEHVLLLAMHHAVSDGWSLGILLRETSRLYAADLEGAPSPLPALPLQFSDYAAWERRRLSGAALDRLLEGWRRRLAGAPAALELPVDRARPAVASYRGARRCVRVPPELTGNIERLSRRLGATVFVTLLAAFDVLLGRLSGADDVVVGTPVAGREHPDLEGLAGCFVNVLPLRVRLAGDPTFAGLVGRVREAMLDALDGADVPIELLVDRLHLERDLGRSPLYQVVLNLYSFDSARLELPGIEAETMDEPTPGSQVDLTVYVRGDGAGLRLDAVYNPDLFDPARVDEVLRQYLHLLAQVVGAPERPIGRLSLVTQHARTVLPDPRTPLPAERQPALLDRLRRHAAAAPDRVAVAGPGLTLAYGELDRASARAAVLLRRAGAGRGQVVAILGDRSPWLVVALLAAMRAGAAFLVLDRGFPPRRLADHVRLARPAAWVELPGAPPPEELASALGGLPRLRLPAPDGPLEPGPEPAGDDPAYVAFTSGSTGQPRGVLGTHAPLWHFLAWYEAAFALTAGDRFAMLAGLSHDPLLRDILAPIWSGARLCVPDAEDWPASEALLRWLREAAVSVVHLTPLQARMLAAVAGPDDVLPDLRLVGFGGDVLLRPDAAAIAGLAPSARLVNFYGTTETPQVISWMPLPASLPPGVATLPVGRGIDTVQLLVMEGDRQAGIGELGEVCVRTPYLAAGYVDGPPGGFGVNPFTGAAGDRLYRTGDLGRHLPDGAVELAGRRDRQVKIRGVRVEPAEVERSLRDLPQVAQAAVTAVERGGDRTLVGYVVTRWPAAPSELRAQLRRRLPDHLVPAELVAVERLPVTANGKLDTPALFGTAAEGPTAGTVERADRRGRARLRPPARRSGVTE
jgi:amino acid adenylation domain-containing protein